MEVEDLPEEIRHAFPKPMPTVGTVRSLEIVEKEYILAALELNASNQTRTAAQLRIGAATLYRKLKGYGMIPDQTGFPPGASRRGALGRSRFIERRRTAWPGWCRSQAQDHLLRSFAEAAATNPTRQRKAIQ